MVFAAIKKLFSSTTFVSLHFFEPVPVNPVMYSNSVALLQSRRGRCSNWYENTIKNTHTSIDSLKNLLFYWRICPFTEEFAFLLRNLPFYWRICPFIEEFALLLRNLPLFFSSTIKRSQKRWRVFVSNGMPSHIFSPAVFSRFVAGSEQRKTTQDFVVNSFVFTAVIPSEEWIWFDVSFRQVLASNRRGTVNWEWCPSSRRTWRWRRSIEGVGQSQATWTANHPTPKNRNKNQPKKIFIHGEPRGSIFEWGNLTERGESSKSLSLWGIENFSFIHSRFVQGKSHVDSKKTLFLGWDELEDDAKKWFSGGGGTWKFGFDLKNPLRNVVLWALEQILFHAEHGCTCIDKNDIFLLFIDGFCKGMMILPKKRFENCRSLE